MPNNTNPFRESRKRLTQGIRVPKRKAEAEGGCGVIGLASSIPVQGKYLLRSLVQMRTRGNGKGGGIAAVGLSPEKLGISADTLQSNYLIQMAYLEPSARKEVERILEEKYEICFGGLVPTLQDYREAGLEIKPPEVCRYFAMPRPEKLDEFQATHRLQAVDLTSLQDEFVDQTAFTLNRTFYESSDPKKQRAFDLSHSKDSMVLKLVGYAEDVIRFYMLEEFPAHVWIGHHRYPTKGKVYHPGGAHPFVGMHYSLVHNGDFSNYRRVSDMLAQHGMTPLFLTDTEVAAMQFDLYTRQFGYPKELAIEAMAPTTERDFHMLSPEKQRLYKQVQLSHLGSAPDGPWFFIIAGNNPQEKKYELIGITDTAMLRPQVFALQEGENQIAVVGSERQAINALLQDLHADRVLPSTVADRYWVARGGSYSNGGAFIFSVDHATRKVECTDKFGNVISTPTDQHHIGRLATQRTLDSLTDLAGKNPHMLFASIVETLQTQTDEAFVASLDSIVTASTRSDEERRVCIETLTLLRDRNYNTRDKKIGSVLGCVDASLVQLFSHIPQDGSIYHPTEWSSRNQLKRNQNPNHTLVIDAQAFPSELEQGSVIGPESAPDGQSFSRFLVKAHQHGWSKIIVYNMCGQRYAGSGIGPHSQGLRIDFYGDTGDYLGSGLDGAELYVHGSGQNEVANIMNYGKLVVYGDVGQAFMYAAKGGDIYIRGNTAGRPLINAVNKPRVVINGTSLDYLGESFMAADPLKGGGFVVLNGIQLENGKIVELDTPYEGGNLFSLASGGALYLRDPHHHVEQNQLNGGAFASFTDRDWSIVQPRLAENERLFRIAIQDLLTVKRNILRPEEVYRKIVPVGAKELKG